MQRGRTMPGRKISRRELIKTGAGMASVAAMPAVIGRRAYAAEASGTVKVVPEVDLKVLDPVWTTALITGTHAFLVYDTLFAADRNYQVHPQMVEA